MLKDEWCELIDRQEFARGATTGLGFSKLSIGVDPRDSSVLICLKRGRGCQHLWLTEAEAEGFISARAGRGIISTLFENLREDMDEAAKTEDERADEREKAEAAEQEKARKLTDKLLKEISSQPKEKRKRGRPRKRKE